MMELVLRFETRELELLPEKTVYNYVCHKLRTPQLGFTHLYEKYDDVAEYPTYELGSFNGDKFTVLATGEGDGVPEGKQSCGGVWVEIKIFDPQYYFM